MASNKVDEGAGATLTFGTSGTSLNVTSIQSAGVSREALETTHHGTTGGYKTYTPGDFTDPGTLQVTFRYDPNIMATNTNPLPLRSAAETITLTYPVPSGEATGATEAASGFITDFDGPAAEIDAVMDATLTIKRSGVITFTTSST